MRYFLSILFAILIFMVLLNAGMITTTSVEASGSTEASQDWDLYYTY